MSNEEFIPGWDRRATGMLISSHARAIVEGPTVGKNNRVDEMEPGAKIKEGFLVNHFRHPLPGPSCLEPAAFHEIVEDMLCVSGDFPHSWI